MTLILIAAVARNLAIGKDNQLLWHLPQDMAFFRKTTQGCPVIMGRKTWDSLPDKFRPLPNRRNIVITRNPNWHADGAQVCFSLTQALSLPDIAQQARVFVIGGAQIYAEALPHADMLLLTQVHTDTEGDAFFPRWDPQDFKETARENHPSSSPTDLAWSWVTYQRVR